MALKDQDVERRISQMVDFIRLEAEEKAKEIGVKANEEYQMQFSKNVQAERLKLLKEHDRKKKAFETKKQIDYSNQLNQCRLKVLDSRSKLVQNVFDEAHSKLEALGKPGAAYKKLLQDLITQGLVTMLESTVTIRCRKSDYNLVQEVVNESVSQFHKKLNNQLECEVSVDTNEFLPEAPSAVNANAPSCCGGVVLRAHNGRITLDNTLDTRLRIAFEDCQPEVRTTLFGKSASRRFTT